MSLFSNRADAGRQLAEDLVPFTKRNPVVLALPRGGVPVAVEVAGRLAAPWDIFVVRKVGVPGHEELAMGAIASGGVRVINEQVVRELNIPMEVFDQAASKELRELTRREKTYRPDRAMIPIEGRTVILIDDGLATGSTMLAAAEAVRVQGPKYLVVAVPVGAKSTCKRLRAHADEVVCHATPDPFGAVGLWYDDFSQTTDAEVHDLLRRAAEASQSGTVPKEADKEPHRRSRRDSLDPLYRTAGDG